MERRPALLFTHSYFLRFDPKQWELGLPYPPLGTLYAASLMREHGYAVALFDTQFATGAGDLLPSLEKNRPDYLVVYDDGFNYLTKMCLTNMREAAFRMAGLAKEYRCKVIFSSSDSTDRYADYLEAGADFVLIGEAEQTLLHLVRTLESGQDPSGVPGIAFRSGENVLKTPGRPVMSDLDALPFPAWDLVDIEPYRASWERNAGYFSLNMSTTRGCPFKCNWCAKPIYGNRYHSRSPENVVGEIRVLKNRFAMDHIWFCDDIFGLKPGWIDRFSSLLEQENLSVRFKIQSRADLLLGERTVRALADAGCETVWIGAESGSQRILDAMDKGITVAQIGEATRLMKEHRIQPSFFIQFGYPGETKVDIALTINMINRLLPHEIGISVSYPLPGTLFYERVHAELVSKSNWTDSDEMALLFRNTFPAAYYKQLHQYVHRNYRAHLAAHHLRNGLRHLLQPAKIELRKAASLLYYLPASWLARRKLKQLEGAPA